MYLFGPPLPSGPTDTARVKGWPAPPTSSLRLSSLSLTPLTLGATTATPSPSSPTPDLTLPTTRSPSPSPLTTSPRLSPTSPLPSLDGVPFSSTSSTWIKTVETLGTQRWLHVLSTLDTAQIDLRNKVFQK